MNDKIAGRVGPVPEPGPPGAGSLHPSVATLRAYADGELRWWQRRLCAGHLAACAVCRIRLAEEADVDRASAELLTTAVPVVDPTDEWERLNVLARRRAESGRPHSSRRLPSRTPGAEGLIGRARGSRLVAGGIGLAAALAAALIGIRTVGHGGAAGSEARLQDLCCWDLDGGGPGDDGIVTVTLPGEHVVGVTVYEDRNGSGTLTEQDSIRYATAPDPRAGGGNVPAGAPLEMHDVCCADYDRGGPADDGVLTESRADVVVRVALYEDEDASRTFTSGDRVRWSSAKR